MRILKLILILSLIFSCSKTESDKRITEFESLLGKRQANALNLLVKDFDKNLNRVYPDLETNQAYRNFLVDVKNKNILDWSDYKFQSSETNKEFIESGLRNEIFNGVSAELEPNYAGKYSDALRKLKESDNLIKGYYEVREAMAGTIRPDLFASEILSSNPDFKNYFHKRIVVLEFSGY